MTTSQDLVLAGPYSGHALPTPVDQYYLLPNLRQVLWCKYTSRSSKTDRAFLVMELTF